MHCVDPYDDMNCVNREVACKFDDVECGRDPDDGPRPGESTYLQNNRRFL